MSDLHYKKDGTLDMRYSSSRQAAASFQAPAANYGSSRSAAPAAPQGHHGGGLHYKKDGSLDMRYSSSKQAAASYQAPAAAAYQAPAANYPSSSSTHVASPQRYDGGGLHYKKDGSLDMRYSSSKQAAASYQAPAANYRSSSSTPAAPQGHHGGGLHYKKDGTLDMRYSSSKQAAASYLASASNYGSSSSTPVASLQRRDGDGLHYKKDGTLDMRYSSSKLAAAGQTSGAGSISSRFASLNVSGGAGHGIPPNVPTKKDGTPDMRTNAARDWVAGQAINNCENVPSWVPRLKDGTINEFSPIGRAYKDAMPPASSIEYQKCDDQERRMEYWARQMTENRDFQRQFESQMEIDVPDPVPSEMSQTTAESSELVEIDSGELETLEEIGRGGFGVVEKAVWRGMLVATKRLHLDRMTRSDTKNFRQELDIARTLHLFQHPNLVATLAYCIQPPILVMEFVKLGSLAFVLHYCEDAEVEAKICDGRIKRKLAYNIADGMLQLHSAGICHRDLKPQNVLITEHWVAKIGDFGLAQLRDLTSCSVATDRLQEEGRQVYNPAGTAAYMAPELLESTKAFEFNCDVYSYGILLNELISEEQPYSGQMDRFGGRGPFAAANYAKMGNRPTIARKVCNHVSDLIQRCWHPEPSSRPKFEEIMRRIENKRFEVPNAGGLPGHSWQ